MRSDQQIRAHGAGVTDIMSNWWERLKGAKEIQSKQTEGKNVEKGSLDVWNRAYKKKGLEKKRVLIEFKWIDILVVVRLMMKGSWRLETINPIPGGGEHFPRLYRFPIQIFYFINNNFISQIDLAITHTFRKTPVCKRY